MLRFAGVVATMVAFITAGSAATSVLAEQPPVAVFITLPMTNGFADATDALVETQMLVHEAVDHVETIRLVDRRQDSDAVLTVLGRGGGYAELTAALQGIDSTVVVDTVMLRSNERYIEAMLAVGPCGDAATSPTRHTASSSCYRKVVVGLDGRVRQIGARSAHDPWTSCAAALAMDVRAWISQNATRLLSLRS